ncbi:MAG: hypothetical protein AB1634_08975 [Thermodesulfobacteriota bacterium]
MEKSREACHIVVERRELATGVVMELIDQSRPLAGDRWQVTLTCQLRTPVPAGVWEEVVRKEPDLAACVRAAMGPELSLVVRKTRQFVAASERAAVLAELIRQVEENILGYLADPNLGVRLFRKEYARLAERCRLELARPVPADAGDDDDGPADFAHLFRTP